MKLQSSNSSDKRKIALIPILVGILLWNLSGSGEDVKTADRVVENSEKTLTEAESLIQQLKKSKEQASQKNWPAFDLDEVVEFDPFSLVGTLAERSGLETNADLLKEESVADSESSAEAAESSDDPIENPLRAVAIGKNGAAALIDSRIVRVGDELEDGIRIVAIEQNAIVVEMVD